MIETKGHALWRAASLLQQVVSGWDAYSQTYSQKYEWSGKPEILGVALNELEPVAQALGFLIIGTQAQRVRRAIAADPNNIRKIVEDSRDLARRVYDELGHHRFFALNPPECLYFEQSKPLWGNGVCEAFRSDLTEDIEEAGKCLALGRNTACVFHLMRVLDVVLEGLAACLRNGEIAKNPNWGTKLEAMRVAINAMPDSPQREEWREARVLLEGVKDGWRNTTMHPQKTYTAVDATHIFHCVQRFTVRLAKLVPVRGDATTH